jgi:phospholipid transport system substrate-binding protein
MNPERAAVAARADSLKRTRGRANNSSMRACVASAASILLVILAPMARADSGPSEVVTQLNQGLLTVLREAEVLGYRKRYERLGGLLRETFDLDYMARQTVGRRWKGLTPEQQQRWLSAFADLTVSTYASRFKSYTGQKFETLGEESSEQDTTVVRSRVVDPAGEDVDLTYRLHRVNSGWKVIDVYLKGNVSEVALRRSEYSTVLKRDGFAALIDAVERKVATMAAGQDASQGP